jgi:uncharacterized membrane protein
VSPPYILFEFLIYELALSIFCRTHIYGCDRFAGALVWLTVALVALGGFFIAWTLLEKAKLKESSSTGDPDHNNTTVLKYLGYAAVAITVIFLAVIISLRKRIQIAIQACKYKPSSDQL